MSVWSWSDPLGLGAFILGIGFTIALLAWSIKTLASIPAQPATRRRSR